MFSTESISHQISPHFGPSRPDPASLPRRLGSENPSAASRSHFPSLVSPPQEAPAGEARQASVTAAAGCFIRWCAAAGRARKPGSEVHGTARQGDAEGQGGTTRRRGGAGRPELARACARFCCSRARDASRAERGCALRGQVHAGGTCGTPDAVLLPAGRGLSSVAPIARICRAAALVDAGGLVDAHGAQWGGRARGLRQGWRRSGSAGVPPAYSSVEVEVEVPLMGARWWLARSRPVGPTGWKAEDGCRRKPYSGSGRSS